MNEIETNWMGWTKFAIGAVFIIYGLISLISAISARKTFAAVLPFFIILVGIWLIWPKLIRKKK